MKEITFKRMLSFLLAISLILGMMPSMTLTVRAAEKKQIGTTSTYWEFDSLKGTLTISGTGNMPDFNSTNNSYVPWRDKVILNVVVEEGVTGIGESTFYDVQYDYQKSIKRVTLPNGLITIGANAFNNCTSLLEINIPESVTTIGGGAFNNCTSLLEINIPESVTTIGSMAFSNNKSLKNVSFPAGVNFNYGNQFENCINLESVTFAAGSKFTALPNNMFSGCKGLKNITLPESLETIGMSAFSGCSGLESITLPESVKTIEMSGFYNCSGLTSITLPESVETIGMSAFSGCSGLTSITLPESVETIGMSAFSGCSGLESITLPGSVKTIGAMTFLSCSKLKEITVKATTPPSGYSGMFAPFATESIETIYVPQGSIAAYSEAEHWRDYVAIIKAIPHEHNFTYSVSGNVLTATCNSTEGDCKLDDGTDEHAHGVSLTLNAPSNPVYSQNTHPCTFGEGQVEKWKAAVGDENVPAIKYALKKNDDTYEDATETVPVNAGTYKATIIAIGDNEKTASVEYTIAPKEIVPIIADISDVTYDGTSKEPVLAVKDDDNALTLGTDYTVEYTNNINAGTATAKVTFMGNYIALPASKNFTINKADQTIEISAIKANSKTEDSVTLEELSGQGDTKYGYNTTTSVPTSWSDSNVITGLAASTEYYFFVKFEGNDNYNPVTSVGVGITTSAHVHKIDENKYHQAVAATCTSPGSKEYWECQKNTCSAKLDANDQEIADITIAINPDAHDWGDSPTYGHDDTDHWEVCSRNSAHTRNKAAHSGGTATCQEKAKCVVCQSAYGDIAEHNYVYTAVNNVLTATCQTAGCTESISLTLETTDKNYSGNVYDGMTIKDSSNCLISDAENNLWRKAGLEAPIVEYKVNNIWVATAPSVVGTYKVRMYPKGVLQNSVNTVEKSFTISKAIISYVAYTEPTVVATETPENNLSIVETEKYTGEITWDPEVTTFGYNTVYNAKVTLSAKENYKFSASVAIPEGWTKSNSSSETNLVLTKTYAATAKAKITSITAPSVGTQLVNFTTETEQKAVLPATVEVVVEDNSTTSMAITWALKGGSTYSTISEAENTFVWTIPVNEYDYYDTNEMSLTGEVTLKNPKHEHTWQYAAIGAELSAVCEEGGKYGCLYDDNHKITLTLSASDTTYSGSDVTAQYGAGEAEKWKNTVETDAPVITYQYKATASGTYEAATETKAVGFYKASATVDTNKTATVEFQITKASQTAPATGVGYTINYLPETLVATADYEVSSTNGINVTALTEDKVTPGTTYYVRKKADENHSASDWTSFTVATRPASPTGLSSENTSVVGGNDGKITDVAATMEYKLSAATTWTAITGTEVTGLSAGTYKVRFKANATTFASEEATISVSNPHEHSGVKQNGQAVTCTEDGWKEYYKCSICSKLFKEETCINEITDLETWKAGDGKLSKLGHHWSYSVDGSTITATCGRGESHGATLTLEAENTTYSDVLEYTGASFDGLTEYKAVVGIETDPTISYHKVDTENATTDGTSIDKSTVRSTPGYYYASAVVGSGNTIVKAFTVFKADAPNAPTNLIAEKPQYISGSDGKITGVNETMEYSTDNGETWKDVTGTEITDLSPGKVLIRVKETETTEAGNSVEITIEKGTEKNPAPNAPTNLTPEKPQYISGTDGKITDVNETMEYSTDNGGTWKDVTGTEITDLSPGKVLVRVKETETTEAGNPVEITIEKGTEKNPAPNAPSGLKPEAPQNGTGSSGEITGVDEKMEYSTDGGQTWKDVEGNKITDLLPGKVIVRLKETETTKAGKPVEITIEKGKAPDAPSGLLPEAPQYYGGSNGKITGVDEMMEYSTDDGETWKDVTGTEITGLSPGIVKVRVKGTEITNPGQSVDITIKDGTDKNPALGSLNDVKVNPASGTDASDGKITGVDSTMEYSIDGGNTWEGITGTEVTGLPAGPVKIRFKYAPEKTITLTIKIKTKPLEEVGNKEVQEHVHTYEWSIWGTVSKESDGTNVYQCSVCGHVLETELIPAYAYACLTEVEHVLKAPQNGSVVCDMGRWNSYPRWFFEKIATRPDVNITLKFIYQHKQYTVFIPARTKIDTSCDWYGPMKICSLYKFERKE